MSGFTPGGGGAAGPASRLQNCSTVRHPALPLSWCMLRGCVSSGLASTALPHAPSAPICCVQRYRAPSSAICAVRPLTSSLKTALCAFLHALPRLRLFVRPPASPFSCVAAKANCRLAAAGWIPGALADSSSGLCSGL